MANQEHLDILEQGVETWNQWREKHPEIRPDLIEVDFRWAYFGGINLTGVNLSNADLDNADLSGVKFNHSSFMKSNLRRANFSGSELGVATFSFANLDNADFSNVNFRATDFSDANLRGAGFFDATLMGVDLSRADLRGADLSETYLNQVNLSKANLTRATMGSTVFGDIDLRLAKGLGLIRHRGPSTIGIDTIYRSEGRIPEIFLRGAGVPDAFITYARSLAHHPIDYYTCFISYSSKDDSFAKRLYVDLQSKGVRCWFAPEDMKIGDNIHMRIDESIRLYDKLLLVLSIHALDSTWVEREVTAAFEKEKQQGQRVLFPIRLDEAVLQTTQAWAADIRRRKHIGDFTRWENYKNYQQAFKRLLRDLKAEA